MMVPCSKPPVRVTRLSTGDGDKAITATLAVRAALREAQE
jgi:hypothetical protein